MRVDVFDFALPQTSIAQSPAQPRHAARMLVVGKTFDDRHVIELPDYLKPGDLLVFNDTKVIPARLFGMRGSAKIELLLHRALPQGEWSAFARPGKKLTPGDQVIIANDFSATVLEKYADGQVRLQFNVQEEALDAQLGKHGIMPLPPYIRRGAAGEPEDKARYQTVYAKHAGAVAAPTAGLHFTEELMATIAAKGIRSAYVTLHVGAGTFQPVKAEDTVDHAMHSEYAVLTQETADLVNRTKKEGGRIVPVGTTSLRTLESAVRENGLVEPFARETDIFITPGYRFQVADMLLTNFHLPKSTLFMLVSAFSGLEKMKAAYAHAVSSGYRFYSYGDACLLTRSEG